MDKSPINIALIDKEFIFYKGLSELLQQFGNRYRFSYYPSFDLFLRGLHKEEPDLVIVNPVFFLHDLSLFRSTRCQHSSVRWIGLFYNICDREVLSLFDGFIQITDSFDYVKETIETINAFRIHPAPGNKASLTRRETEVLRLILQSLSNNEIAVKLHISVHTVMSHRKNIFRKTGTCKAFDLVNYAIREKII